MIRESIFVGWLRSCLCLIAWVGRYWPTPHSRIEDSPHRPATELAACALRRNRVRTMAVWIPAFAGMTPLARSARSAPTPENCISFPVIPAKAGIQGSSGQCSSQARKPNTDAAGRRFAVRHLDPAARSRRRRNTPISFAACRSPLAVAEAIPRRQASAAASVSPPSAHALPRSFQAAEYDGSSSIARSRCRRDATGVGAFEAGLAEAEPYRRAVLAGRDQRLQVRDESFGIHRQPRQNVGESSTSRVKISSRPSSMANDRSHFAVSLMSA